MRRVRTTTIASLAVIAVVFFALGAAGDAGSQSDPTGDPSGGADGSNVLIDITEVRHSDDGSSISWSFHTASTFDPELALDTVRWDLDLNSNGTLNELGTDACIELQPLFNGTGTMRASLKASCGPFIAGTADATFIGGNDVTVEFANDFFRSATGFTLDTYQYQVTSSDLDVWVDRVPNATDQFVTHSSVAAVGETPGPSDGGTPTPTPTPSGSATPTPSGSATPTPTPGPNDTTADGTPSKSTVAPGEAVALSAASGFEPGTSLTIVMNSDPITLASISADGTGGFSATVTIPSTAEAGSHNIVVSGANANDGIHRLTFPITVAVASATSSPLASGADTTSGANLPNTGISLVTLVVMAAALILFGIELFWGAERLRRDESR